MIPSSFPALESWEKVTVNSIKPQPRSESVAIAVPSLILSGSYMTPSESKTTSRVRIRSCNSADRGNRHSSYLPNNKVRFLCSHFCAFPFNKPKTQEGNLNLIVSYRVNRNEIRYSGYSNFKNFKKL